MLDISFSLNSPFKPYRHTPIGEVYFKHLNNFKTLEIETYKSNVYIKFTLSISTRLSRDHHGVDLSLGLAGYNISIMWYDWRHREDFDSV